MNRRSRNLTKGLSRREIEERLITKAWEDKAFKKELLKAPKVVVERELTALLGKSVKLSPKIQIQVHEETKNRIHLVLPLSPDTLASEASDFVGFWENTFQYRKC